MLRQRHGVDAQASLRENLTNEIATAQTMLSVQLAELQQAGADSGVLAEVKNQLAALKVLGQNITTASGSALMQLRNEVSASVAASYAAVQQAQSAVVAASATAAQGDYAKATAELDRRAAVLRSADKKREDDAHDMAERFGIDLKDFDKERAELERQRQEAIAHGDKVGERQTDVLILENTKNSMVAAGAKITDPDERKRHEQEIANAQKDENEARNLLAKQLELDGRQRAANLGLTGKEADAYVANLKATGVAENAEQVKHLYGATTADAATSAAFAAERKAAIAQVAPASPDADIHAALTPEARAATQQAVAGIATSFDNFAATLSIDGTSQIALSNAPHAHTTVEAPVTKTAIAATSQGQSRA